MNILKPEDLLFRCSGLSELLTEPQGKTKKEQYDEAVLNRNKWQNDYSLMANKQTKAAAKKLAQIQKANTKILQLQTSKDDIELSSACVKQLLKTYAQAVHSRHQAIKSKYFTKGNFREPDAITVLSRNLQINFQKNIERLSNKYVTGELDLFIGENILKAKHTYDTKCSWSYETFLQAQFEELNPAYEWQGHGYMWLSNAERHTVAYCLVNGTLHAINDEVRKLAWEMGVLDASVENDPAFIKGCKQIEINHIFEIDAFCKENPNHEFYNEVEFDGKDYHWAYDIPVEKRMHLKTFDRSEGAIQEAKERIIEVRNFAAKNLFEKQL